MAMAAEKCANKIEARKYFISAEGVAWGSGETKKQAGEKAKARRHALENRHFSGEKMEGWGNQARWRRSINHQYLTRPNALYP